MRLSAFFFTSIAPQLVTLYGVLLLLELRCKSLLVRSASYDPRAPFFVSLSLERLLDSRHNSWWKAATGMVEGISITRAAATLVYRTWEACSEDFNRHRLRDKRIQRPNLVTPSSTRDGWRGTVLVFEVAERRTSLMYDVCDFPFSHLKVIFKDFIDRYRARVQHDKKNLIPWFGLRFFGVDPILTPYNAYPGFLNQG